MQLGACYAAARIITGITMSGVIDVTAYGAVGDGSTDDTSAIASALAACPSSNFALYFPLGIYLCNPNSAGLQSLASKSDFTIYGGAMTASCIKSSTGSIVLNIADSCSQVVIRDLCLDGGCTSRTSGQHALVVDSSYTHLRNVRVINSGQFAMYFGQNMDNLLVTDLTIENCVVQACYADGIHIGYCKNVLISGNLIDGSDDDCIAVGYGPGGVANNVVVANNICRARTDLGTAGGRGIVVLRASNVQVIGNLIENIKQDGVLVYTDNASLRPTNILIFGNTINNTALDSGNAMSLYFISNGNVAFNKIYDPVYGDGINLCDWQNLTVSNNDISSDLNQYFRGLHATEANSVEGVSVTSPFNALKVVNNTISLLSGGGNTTYNECIRVNPGGVDIWTQDSTIISGNTCYQASGTNTSLYLDFDYGSGGASKIVNNTCAQQRVVGTGSNHSSPPINLNNN